MKDDRDRNETKYVGTKWLIAILVAVIGFGGGLWVTTVEGRFSEAATIRLAGFSRLSAVEKDVDGITSRLDRIENKLDKVLGITPS